LNVLYLQQQKKLTLTRQLPDITLTKLQQNQLVTLCSEIFSQTHIVFLSKQSLNNIITCIVHKLKTGWQRRNLFIDNQEFKTH
jgi:hypothetical protein